MLLRYHLQKGNMRCFSVLEVRTLAASLLIFLISFLFVQKSAHTLTTTDSLKEKKYGRISSKPSISRKFQSRFSQKSMPRANGALMN
ncbi:hypothetical protein LINGRAHAP2_LOCUS28608 [Linum grandiflorum]